MDLPPSCALDRASACPRLPHLWSAALAVLAAGLILVTLDGMAGWRIARHAAGLTELNLPESIHGVALQRQMATRPGCLMVYGSSELSNFEPTRADLFFRSHPAGFRPVMIGQPGDRCLIILQELAALGESARGRKFVVFLSPSWFVAPRNPRVLTRLNRLFAREFSPVQTSALLLNGRLDRPLKGKIARRLLEQNNQDVIGDASPLLACVLDTLQGRSPWQAALFALLQPLLVLQADTFCWQDRWETAYLTIAHDTPSLGPDPMDNQSLDWAELRRKMDETLAQRGFATPYSLDLPAHKPPKFLTEPAPLELYPHGDGEFLDRINASPEWVDLELLLQTIRRIGARVLLVGQPFNGAVYDACHVGAQTRRQYYGRVLALASANGVALDDFAQYEDDHSFFFDLVHPSAKAWIYYNQVITRFYHAPD